MVYGLILATLKACRWQDKAGQEAQRHDWRNRQLKLETRDLTGRHTGDAGEDTQREDPEKQGMKGNRLNKSVP